MILSRRKSLIWSVLPTFLSRRKSSSIAHLYNSLSGEIEPFEKKKKQLKWYSCGPTVYDVAHLGHARTYVTQDILFRILSKHFHYDIQLVLGMTDVDDKILQKAKQTQQNPLELARKVESGFLKDMAKLNVLSPDSITRVSEHIPQIIQYIRVIQEKGFAYESPDGSGVYFDTCQLGNSYGKLDPDTTKHADNNVLQTEQQKKKNARDFALWKTAKSDKELSWDSPWGKGRPGWHIECSAMSHHVLGDSLDLHSGGIDLCFPHHNNEIAQCDAFHHVDGENKEWCNHFIHFGHLYIEGLKMSKSLKNFISVSDFLSHESEKGSDTSVAFKSDLFRIFCLSHKYRSNLHYSDERIREAKHIAVKIMNFFSCSRQYIILYQKNSDENKHLPKKWTENDFILNDKLSDTKKMVNSALSNDMDTPEVLRILLNLISSANVGISNSSSCSSSISPELVSSVCRYVLHYLSLFGLDAICSRYKNLDSIWLNKEDGSKSIPNDFDGETPELSENIHEIIDSFVKFRAMVRKEALNHIDGSSDVNNSLANILAISDKLRNDDLIKNGIHIEDFNGKSSWKVGVARLVDSSRGTANEKGCRKLLAKKESFKKLMEIHPNDFFRLNLDFQDSNFSHFDDQGIPTHIDGEELSKSGRKKLRKKFEKHCKSYEKYHKYS